MLNEEQKVSLKAYCTAKNETHMQHPDITKTVSRKKTFQVQNSLH